mmetsp:Transcript_66985/g.146843  ORF Transcript_66985/g.146843 Transcript_66985/m.146843 type:complete len:196 (+) Transcript_66985:143-730(+)
MPPRADRVRIHPACLGDDPAQDQDLAQVGDDSEELAKLMDGSGSSSESTTKGKGQLPLHVVHPSRGSEKHHSGSCQPCSFFLRGKCTVAEGCLYCHYEHDRPQRPGKKSRERAKRRIAIAQATEPSYAGANSPPGTVPGAVSHQHGFGSLLTLERMQNMVLSRNPQMQSDGQLPVFPPEPDLLDLPDPPPGVIRL